MQVKEVSICQNCGKEWPDAELRDIEELMDRVSPGELVPSGECPSCGALCSPKHAYAMKPALDSLERLVEYLLEAHEDELTSKHNGDSTHDGQSPEDCSYCNAIDEAKSILEENGREVSRG